MHVCPACFACYYPLIVSQNCVHDTLGPLISVRQTGRIRRSTRRWNSSVSRTLLTRPGTGEFDHVDLRIAMCPLGKLYVAVITDERECAHLVEATTCVQLGV
jgi:hypothetical protein